MKLPHGTWVVVADGARMLVLENAGDEVYLDLRVVRHGEEAAPPTREVGTDRPGRYDTPAGKRGAVEQTDWHTLEKDRFAAGLAERMNGWAQAGRFRHAVLIAAPRTMGELRRHLTGAARGLMLAEIPADLAHRTIGEIEGAVAKA